MKCIMKYREGDCFPWKYYEGDNKEQCLEMLKQIVKKDGWCYDYEIILYEANLIEKGKVKYSNLKESLIIK